MRVLQTLGRGQHLSVLVRRLNYEEDGLRVKK